MRRVTLLTDFGTGDGYVAEMKGVLASLAPGVAIDDAGHDVPRGDVRRATVALRRYWRRYPAGTVHVVVVDPGVGTDRRALALEAEGRFVVAPDNGVASGVLEAAGRARCVAIDADRLEAPEQRSATFHGRDVFAPAAARLLLDAELETLGPPLADPVLLEEPAPRRRPGGGGGPAGAGARSGVDAEGEVVAVDGFGNLVTNLPAAWVAGGGTLVVAGRSIPLRRTYAEAEEGEVLGLVNSEGRVEVAVRNGSAAERLRAGPGTSVRLTTSEP